MKGQTLIEVLISLTLAVIIISAITATVLSSLSSAEFSKNQSIAQQYAQEGLEIARDNLSVGDGSYCLDQGMTTLPPAPTPSAIDGSGQCATANLNPDPLNNPTGAKTFKRTITITKSGTTCPVAPGTTLSFARVSVNVSWNDGKCGGGSFCHQAKVETCM